MKQSILTVLGAMFILIGFFGGGSFDVGFAKANVEKNSVSPLLRIIAVVFGAAMIFSQSSVVISFFEKFSYIHSKDRIETYQVNVISPTPIQSAKVLKGQRLTFYPNETYKVNCKGDFQIEGSWVGPAGSGSFSTENLIMDKEPFCSLIAKVDGDGSRWHNVGGSIKSFTAEASGPLILTVNDLADGHCPDTQSDACWKDNKQNNASVRISYSR